MKLIEETGSAYFHFNVNGEVVYEKFDFTGVIGTIQLRLRPDKINDYWKMRIGGFTLASEDLPNIAQAKPDGGITYQFSAGIVFNAGDDFLFEQPDKSVEEITIWLNSKKARRGYLTNDVISGKWVIHDGKIPREEAYYILPEQETILNSRHEGVRFYYEVVDGKAKLFFN